MCITNEIVNKAKEIRATAAIKYNVNINEISWKECMKMALNNEEVEIDQELLEKKQDEVNNTIVSLKEAINELELNFDTANINVEKLTESIELIGSINEKIAEQKELLAEQKKVEQDKVEKVEQDLDGVLDIDDIISIRDVMIRNHVCSNRSKKAKFSDAKDELVVYRNSLRDLGLESEGLNFLIEANVNRSDRDDCSVISKAEILNITNIE